MPTTRPRHAITETDDIARILDEAARRWGDLPRTKLVQLILADWAEGNHSPQARQLARSELAGSLPGTSGIYNRDDDWPQ